jgi:hypothetical protein
MAHRDSVGRRHELVRVLRPQSTVDGADGTLVRRPPLDAGVEQLAQPGPDGTDPSERTVACGVVRIGRGELSLDHLTVEQLVVGQPADGRLETVEAIHPRAPYLLIGVDEVEPVAQRGLVAVARVGVPCR